jgi:hypothetical protein
MASEEILPTIMNVSREGSCNCLESISINWFKIHVFSLRTTTKK